MKLSDRPLSLAHRIVASVALGLGFTLVLFGLVAVWTIRESTEAAYLERVTLAQVLASRVDDMLQYALVSLEWEAANLRLERGLPLTENQHQRLSDLRHRIGSFAAVSLADAAGMVVWTAPTPADVVIGQPLDHPSVRVVLSTGQPQIGELVVEGEQDQVFASVTVPLRNSDGHLVGTLLAKVDPGHPSLNLLPTGVVGPGIEAQLVNADGRFLAGTSDYNPRYVAEHIALLANLVQGPSAGYRLHEPRPGVSFPSHVVAYAPVSLLPSWGVTVEQPQDLVLAATHRLRERLALFGAAALLAAMLVAWFDVRRVVWPLKRLTMAAEQFAAGRFEEPVRLNRPDELGILARAFETMRQRLRASLAEVAEWNRSALVEPERVIALVVQKARELMRAEVAGLSLVEEGSNNLTWRFLAGGSDRFHLIRLTVGEGIAGYVVQTGRPLAIADWHHPPSEGPATAPILTGEGLRAALAVPLQSGGRSFGVLMVANRAPTTFSDDQITLLSTLADHAAVALENARLYRKVQDLAVLEERERIAREMHDGLGQVLAYVNVQVLAVNRLLEMGKLDEARAEVGRLQAAAREVYADVREGILGLRTTLDPQQGFLPALGEYLDGFRRQSGLLAELEAPEAEAELDLPFSAEIQLLRIAQEALANVRKHARATRATVRLTPADGLLQLTIEDDGQGFDPARFTREGWPRFGLQTMRERAQAIGGSFAVESRPGAGTRVTVTIPQLQPEEVFDVADARPVGR